MLNKPGQDVVSFASALRNSSQVGTYADLVVRMFTSKTWRAYETALGSVRWRSHEFDFFLIACDAQYADILQIMRWDSERGAIIAPAMTGPASPERRTLTEASAKWESGVQETLLERAQRNGWVRKDRLVMKHAPVAARARLRAKKNMTKEDMARQRRRQQLGARRERLDQLVTMILARTVDAQEVAYIIDELRSKRSATKLRLIRSIKP